MIPPAPATGNGRSFSLRQRLLALALLPLGVVLPLLLYTLLNWGNDYLDRLLINKVGSDMVVASSYYERVSAGIGVAVEGLAGSSGLAVQQRRGPAALQTWLDAERVRLKLDFLYVLGADGCVQAAAHGQSRRLCLGGWPVIARALAGEARVENDVFPSQLLAAMDEALASRARVELLPTQNALPDWRQVEDRGLVVHGAAPIRDRQGQVVGVLSGGLLLNRNLEFVDRLNEIVYPERTLPLGSVGTATLFLDDVRVATNVRLFEGQRAIGTRVSQAVRVAVLGQGQTWLDRAFVVKDWYVSGYQPLIDSHGKRVGMLYVGFLETPFAQAKRSALISILIIFGLAMLVAAVFAVLWARRIFRPVERMHATMNAVEEGQLDARVGSLGLRDEIGELAEHLDRLLERQQQQARALRRWGESLDEEVARRTGELERALANLRQTQGKLVANEKLAAIGQLTAGVAHEINNPVAVIQGNLEVAQELLGPEAKAVAPEFKLIHEQVHRIRQIIAKLLQFARPQEYVGYLEPVNASQVVQDCLVLVGHLLRKGNVAIEQRLESGRLVTCNKNELQQVVINLMVNAIQAMPEGGVLTLASEDWDESDMPIGLKLSVADTGPGISAEDQQRLFEPFFTVGKPGGHGLGLWISHSLIERYGGRITVESPPGQGARFVIWLRQELNDA